MVKLRGTRPSSPKKKSLLSVVKTLSESSDRNRKPSVCASLSTGPFGWAQGSGGCCSISRSWNACGERHYWLLIQKINNSQKLKLWDAVSVSEPQNFRILKIWKTVECCQCQRIDCLRNCGPFGWSANLWAVRLGSGGSRNACGERHYWLIIPKNREFHKIEDSIMSVNSW